MLDIKEDKEKLHLKLENLLSDMNLTSTLNENKEDPKMNKSYNYINVDNVFGFWILKLIDMYNDKYFNINWTHYKLISERDFNISESDFTWDLVDDYLSDYMIDIHSDLANKNTVHEFNKLKKNYFNWINIPNDNGKYFWDIKLSVIDNDKDFQKIWNWATITDGARYLLANISTVIDWDLVDLKIFKYITDKTTYFNNINFISDLKAELFINQILAIKGKYKDYIFLMNSNFYFNDISREKDFQRTISWERVEIEIKMLLNTNQTENLNMTLVDMKIKQYEFNNKNFTLKEVKIIKNLIKVERQYSDYLNKNNGLSNSNKKTSNSNGLIPDIGNNIHQGTITINMLYNMYVSINIRGGTLKKLCTNECLENCEKRFLLHKSKKSLFSCLSVICFCDEQFYNKKFNFTDNDMIYHDNLSKSTYSFIGFFFILTLIILVIFYENNKNSDLFLCFTKNDVNNITIVDESKKRDEKTYDYILLNEHQVYI